MGETADRVLGGCRIALLIVTAVIQIGLSLPVVTGAASAYAFAALGAVLVVAAFWVLRGRAVPWPVAGMAAVMVLTASAVATWAVPPGELFGDRHWVFGLAGWHLLVLLLDRPVAAVAALGAQLALTLVRLVASAPTDRFEIGGVVIVGLSVITFQAATLALVRIVNRRAGEAAEASAERDRLAHRKALAEQREADQRSRFAGQLGATLPLLAGLADRTLDPRDEAVRQRCALAATQLRRLFAENDEVPDPLVHEVSACVDLAERRGLTVTLAVSGEPAPVPTDVRRELTGPLMTALVAARSQARVSVLRTGDEIRVAAITDGEPGTRSNGSDAVDVEWHALGERSWMEAKWRSRQN
ncbi:histidine kinase [Amycolatopsis umgeniensis]|uniref:Membrane protein implicated in regulation of membrane protease activity n=1 Tax=Amycolatopsis umgeniensis TaxID=336628 RepID=A0A841AUT7_9PSEU|nr:histidine kinase [Amycolatopsis umgeniensis]MBB5850082.1 membrane protein implicated in regulation of membrane protease activity [Amycolatopsis umgeniensis]